MNVLEVIDELTDEFKDFKPILQEHIEFNEELLPHVFFADCNNVFINLIKENNPQVLNKLFNFFERMAADGNNDVKEILTVSILEVLGDDRHVLNIAHKYMGVETRKASDEIEKYWGRY
jgi:hypothetical protein